MKLVAVQHAVCWEQASAPLDGVRRLLSDKEIPQGSLIVFPEMFSTGFSMEPGRVAEGEDRLAERFLSDVATRTASWTLGGVVTLAADGRGRNQAAAFGPKGAEVARYDKLHPFSFAGETRQYVPGEATVRFVAGPMVVAPVSCYDLRFPETFRAWVPAATVFAVLANWPTVRVEHWLALIRARAIENQAYVIAVNRCGEDPKLAYPGRSQIIDPKGQVLADAGGEPAVIEAEVDVEALAMYRRKFPVLADRREEYR